jgi:excisionase family DNA binding protein
MKKAEQYLTGQDVQDLLKISRTTLYRIMKKGKIKLVKFGKTKRYKLSDIEKLAK